MILIGLTGGIAAGKSTVSKIFTDNGVTVIDADVIARSGKSIVKCDKNKNYQKKLNC